MKGKSFAKTRSFFLLLSWQNLFWAEFRVCQLDRDRQRKNFYEGGETIERINNQKLRWTAADAERENACEDPRDLRSVVLWADARKRIPDASRRKSDRRSEIGVHQMDRRTHGKMITKKFGKEVKRPSDQEWKSMFRAIPSCANLSAGAVLSTKLS